MSGSDQVFATEVARLSRFTLAREDRDSRLFCTCRIVVLSALPALEALAVGCAVIVVATSLAIFSGAMRKIANEVALAAARFVLARKALDRDRASRRPRGMGARVRFAAAAAKLRNRRPASGDFARMFGSSARSIPRKHPPPESRHESPHLPQHDHRDVWLGCPGGTGGWIRRGLQGSTTAGCRRFARRRSFDSRGCGFFRRKTRDPQDAKMRASLRLRAHNRRAREQARRRGGVVAGAPAMDCMGARPS